MLYLLTLRVRLDCRVRVMHLLLIHRLQTSIAYCRRHDRNELGELNKNIFYLVTHKYMNAQLKTMWNQLHFDCMCNLLDL